MKYNTDGRNRCVHGADLFTATRARMQTHDHIQAKYYTLKHHLLQRSHRTSLHQSFVSNSFSWRCFSASNPMWIMYAPTLPYFSLMYLIVSLIAPAEEKKQGERNKNKQEILQVWSLSRQKAERV